MKQFPTLIDQVYHDTYKYPKTLTSDLRQKLIEARRFMLDDEMSAFLADIGWAAYKITQWNEGYDLNKPGELQKVMQRYSKHVISLIDHTRKMARLPYKVTWIEWNEKPLARRARAEYGSQMDERLVPEKTGWLLMQHPHVETAFKALGFGIGTTNFGSEGKRAVGSTPFCQMWQTEDEPLPWNHHPYTLNADGTLREFGGSVAGGCISEILTGLPYYITPYLGFTSAHPFYTRWALDRIQTVEEFDRVMVEQGGMLRYLWGLLATINDLPVSAKHVTTSKGFVAKGNYRRFLEHSVITLKVPMERYKALARKAVTMMRRRAHQVRGHWRDDWRHPGQKIWVKEHQRGDASLGFVLHDYTVEKGKT